jgi:anti-anti-sigma factor
LSEPQANPPLEREDFGAVTVLRARLPMLRSDEATEAFYRQLSAVVEDAGRYRLVLNFAGVMSMSSMAIGKLVILMRKVRQAGGRLAMCKLTPTMDEIMQACYLAEIIPIYADEQEAVASFAGQ